MSWQRGRRANRSFCEREALVCIGEDEYCNDDNGAAVSIYGNGQTSSAANCQKPTHSIPHFIILFQFILALVLNIRAPGIIPLKQSCLWYQYPVMREIPAGPGHYPTTKL